MPVSIPVYLSSLSIIYGQTFQLRHMIYVHLHMYIPWFSVSPHAAVQVLGQVSQYLFEILIHGLLTLGDDGWPDIGHGQLDAWAGIILVAVESRDECGKVGSKLFLSLTSYATKSKGSTLCVYNIMIVLIWWMIAKLKISQCMHTHPWH